MTGGNQGISGEGRGALEDPGGTAERGGTVQQAGDHSQPVTEVGFRWGHETGSEDL